MLKSRTAGEADICYSRVGQVDRDLWRANFLLRCVTEVSKVLPRIGKNNEQSYSQDILWRGIIFKDITLSLIRSMPLSIDTEQNGVCPPNKEEEQSIQSIAASIILKSKKSYILVFHGKEVGNFAIPGNADSCVHTEPTLESLSAILEEIHSVLSSASSPPPHETLSCVRGIHFVDYAFTHLPENIGRVFTEIKQVSFYKCHELSSFSSTLKQFPSLTSLAARDCHNLVSLSSLSDIPQQISLQAIRINNCGLRITSDGDWEEAMRALGDTPSGGLVLNITSCRHLKRLPSSMKYLSNVLSCLRLESNYNLNRLPEELGQLKYMVEFQLINCPSVYTLPPSMRCLKNDCKVSITGNNTLVERISNDTKKCKGSKESSYYSQKIGKMTGYFLQTRIRQLKATVMLSALLRRSRFRAIHRIYRPGGVGFLRSRDHFQMMVMISSHPANHVVAALSEV